MLGLRSIVCCGDQAEAARQAELARQRAAAAEAERLRQAQQRAAAEAAAREAERRRLREEQRQAAERARAAAEEARRRSAPLPTCQSPALGSVGPFWALDCYCLQAPLLEFLDLCINFRWSSVRHC